MTTLLPIDETNIWPVFSSISRPPIFIQMIFLQILYSFSWHTFIPFHKVKILLNRSHKFPKDKSGWNPKRRAEKFTTLQFAQYFLKLCRISSRMAQFGPFGRCNRMSTLERQTICIWFDLQSIALHTSALFINPIFVLALTASHSHYSLKPKL